MKEIFVGSSTGALPHAVQVRDALSELAGVRPLLWTECFDTGTIFLTEIDALADRVAGAILLATPDDKANSRSRDIVLPRDNVIFEYGYFAARLTLPRVALGKYDNAELPTDLQGLTYADMGFFDPNAAVSKEAMGKLVRWATRLRALQPGLPPTLLQHGYAGAWDCKRTFSKWRGQEVKHPNYVVFKGTLVLSIGTDGSVETGCMFGALLVHFDGCKAEFMINDEVISGLVDSNGGLTIESVMQSRQLRAIHGPVPMAFKDGDAFDPQLSFESSRDFVTELKVDESRAGELVGAYRRTIGREVVSEAETHLRRLHCPCRLG
jgi:hypothetical protein